MSQKGWHLKRAAPFGEYLFSAGEPRDIVYRLDYVQVTRKNEDYFQLFRDAGWDYAGEMMGWQYWRMENQGNRMPEIFTDTDSKVKKYGRILGWMIIFLPVLVFGLPRFTDITENRNSLLVVGCFLLYTILVLFYSYAVLRLGLRIQSLRKKN